MLMSLLCVCEITKSIKEQLGKRVLRKSRAQWNKKQTHPLHSLRFKKT